MIGRTISHYKITEKLGEGGMGVVYKAEDTKLKREVALKFLPTHLLGNADIRARFEREAQAAAALHHPNICPVFEIDDVNGKAFIAMAFIDGDSLDKRIAEGPLKLDEALDIAGQIARGLGAAHKKGIFHRDIKPENLIVDDTGHVTIMDFGLAQLTEASRLTKTDETLGTIAYMSPEQTEGSGTDHRADIWSLGVVVYEMITGQQPFKGDYDKAVMYSILNEPPEPITALRSAVPMELEFVIGKCLAKTKEQRYEHTDELIHDLALLREGLRDGATRVPKTQAAAANSNLLLRYRVSGTSEEQGGGISHRAEDTVLKKPVTIRIADDDTLRSLERRQRVRNRALTVAAAVGTLGALLFAALWLRSSPSTPVPLRKFMIEPEEAAGDAVISPDGRYLAYTVGSGPTQLRIHDLAQGESRVLGGADDAQFPVWSPDSLYIAFIRGRRLYKVPAEGGPVVELSRAPRSVFAGTAWSPNGESIIYAGSGVIRESAYDLLEAPAGGGDSIVLSAHNETLAEGRAFVYPSFLPAPADRRVLLGSLGQDSESEIAVMNLENGTVRVLANGAWPVYSPDGHILYEARGNTSGIWALPFSVETLEATGEPFAVSRNPGRPSVTLEGTLAYFDNGRGSLSQMVWRDRSGARLGTVGDPHPSIRQPAISPDGSRVVVMALEEGRRGLWVYDVDDGVRTKLTFGRHDKIKGVWLPDGERISYSVVRPNNADVVIKRADGVGGETPLLSGPLNEWLNSWSADGRHAAYYVNSPDKGSDLWNLQRNGEGGSYEAVPFLQSPDSESEPSLSPDAHYVAYTSHESGSSQVHVRPFPKGEGEWLISSNGGTQTCWSRDGKELFYVEHDTLIAVSVSTSLRFKKGTAERLFSSAALRSVSSFALYDVSPDGQRFLLVERVDRTGKAPIHVVQNWYEEFRDPEQN